MHDYPDTLNHMLAAWNELDVSRVRAHLEKAVSAKVRFVDPTHDITGLDAFEEMVRAFRARLPDAICSRTTNVDSHHRLHRYQWAIHSGDSLLLPGFDVVETDEEGYVISVLGFFGTLEAGAS